MLNTYPETLSAKAALQLERLGVEVRVNARVVEVDGAGVTIEQATGQSEDAPTERIAARTVLWAAGVQATPLARSLPDRTIGPGASSLRRRCKSRTLNRYRGGDLASVTRTASKCPGGLCGETDGCYAARTIAMLVAGNHSASHAPFRYRDQGSLATIGRKSAVAVFPFGLRLSGLVAWWTWLLVHIFFLIGFRNRITTMVDWMLAYFTHQRHARLILNDGPARPARPA